MSADAVSVTWSGDPVVSELFNQPAVEGRRLELNAGTTIYEPGTPAEKLYYVQRGQVRIYQLGPDGEGRLLEILGPGNWFGCAALTPTRTYATRAVTVGKAVVTEASVEKLLAAMAQAPQAAAAVIQQLAFGLQSAREDAARLVFDDCNQRLVKTLLRFSRSAAATQRPDGLGVVLHITHEQLAQAIGVARETVSLALTEMRLQNLVRTGRNQLSFDPEALRNFAGRATTNGRHKQPPRVVVEEREVEQQVA
jgi:CRP/FNR family transcriptional regulator